MAAVVCALAGLGALGPSLTAASASAPASVRVGTPPRAPRGARVVGSLPDATRLSATVVLEPRDPTALAAYATAVATPGSSVFRQYLTVAQFAARFAPTPGQIGDVESALRQRGLAPGAVSSNGLSIPVSATARQFAQAFSTGFNTVVLPSGRRAFTNTQAPLFEADVARLVQGVVGLDSLAQAQPLELVRPRARVARAAPQVVTGGPQPCPAAQTAAAPNDAYTADQIASAYRFSSEYEAGDEGAGQTVALYELEPFSSSDISAYQSCYGTSASVSTVKVDGGAGSGAGSGEAALDIEDVIGLAPKASFVVYEGPNTSTGAYDTYQKIVSNDTAKVISTSWGLCEPDQGSSAASAENTLFQEAATQGQSIFAAAGDSGSEDCYDPINGSFDESLEVDDPASQPYVTGVGGTTLSALGPPPTQVVWDGDTPSNECSDGPCGGGGGISTLWRMPSYQSGAPARLNVINSNSSASPCSSSSGSGDCREVPDVSADADPFTGYLIYYGGGWTGIGGTSAAAPTWAAFTALVNASSACGGKPIGFANPVLYEAAASSYASDFSDITTSNNDILNANNGLYPAGAGYDMASGLGTPIGSTLPGTLCATAEVTPAGTVTMPDANAEPTAVVIDPTNHIAYIAESKANAVAKVTGTNASSFSGTATDVADAGLCATSCVLPGLNFPDGLALNSSEQLFASDFCVGSQASVCAVEPSGTTTAVSQQTGTATGQGDSLAGCRYPSGEAVFTPSSGASRLFVACAGSGIVDECAPSGGTPACGTASPATVAISEPTGGGQPVPSGVAAVPTETSTPAVIVADAENSTLSVVTLNGSTLTASAPSQLGAGCEPAYVAVGPASGASAAVYVACPGNGTIEVGTVSGTGTPALGSFSATSLPTAGSSTPRPYGIAVNTTGTLLTVSDAANNDAVIYPSLSGTTLGGAAVVSVGSTPDGVAIDGTNAFVANEGSGTVTVIDPRTSHKRRHKVPRRGARHAVSLTPLIAPLPGRAHRPPAK